MRRTFLGAAVALVLIVIVPPAWYGLFPSPLPALPPEGREVVTSDGVGINVVDTGSGPPIVLTHGLPGSAYDWRELTPLLADQGFRVIAYDRLGYGHSDLRPDENYTIEANTNDLLALINALELDSVTVAGWSYGGAIVARAALTNPRVISRVVLISTTGPTARGQEPPPPPLPVRVLYSPPASLWRQAVPPVSYSLMAAFSDTAFRDAPQPDWWMETLKANAGRPATALTFSKEMLAMAESEQPSFEAIRQPTLLIHGEDDGNAPVEISRYLNTIIPNARYIEVSHAGHMLPVTHEALLAHEIRAFVDAADQSPSNTEAQSSRASS